MNLEIYSIEKRKGASLVRMMRPMLRRERLLRHRLQPAFAASGIEVPLEPSSLVRDGEQPVVAAAVFDTDAVDRNVERFRLAQHLESRIGPLRVLRCGEGNLPSLVAKPEGIEEFLARRARGDLVLIGHNDLLTMCISLVRGGKYCPVAPRSHLPIPSRNSAISIAYTGYLVKQNREKQKSPYFRAFFDYESAVYSTTYSLMDLFISASRFCSGISFHFSQVKVKILPQFLHVALGPPVRSLVSGFIPSQKPSCFNNSCLQLSCCILKKFSSPLN